MMRENQAAMRAGEAGRLHDVNVPADIVADAMKASQANGVPTWPIVFLNDMDVDPDGQL